MRTQMTDSKSGQERRPSPTTGLLFLLAGLGCFYGLISVVDPLL